MTVTAIDDLKAFHTGLPAAAEWATSFDRSWTVAQIQAGRRIIPTAPLPYYDVTEANASANSFVTKGLANFPEAWAFLRDNGLPLILRHNNLVKTFDSKRYDGQTIATSPRIFRVVNGQMVDQKTADPLGPADPLGNEPWRTEGQLLATSPFMQALQNLHPSPAWTMLADNNETDIEQWSAFSVKGPNFSPPRGYVNFTWPADLAAYSVRLRDRVQQAGYPTPYDYLPEWDRLNVEKRHAWRDSFVARLTPAYRDFRMVAYSALYSGFQPPQPILDQIGKNPELNRYDSGGPAVYLDKTKYRNLLDPSHAQDLDNAAIGWRWIRERNPRAFRTVFTSVTKTSALAAAQSKQHEVIDPTLYQAYLEWVLWTAREPGVPVLLYHWIGSGTKPGDLFFANSDIATLGQLGRVELQPLTHGDYVLSCAKACDRICDNAELREFWLHGTRIELLGQTEQFRYVATKLGDKCLVYVWSPCKIAGDVPISVPGFGEFSKPVTLGGKYYVREHLLAPEFVTREIQ